MNTPYTKEKVLTSCFQTKTNDYNSVILFSSQDIQDFINDNIAKGYTLFSITPIPTFGDTVHGSGCFYSGVLVTMILKDTEETK